MKQRLLYVIVPLLSFAFTALIFLNTYEVVFNKDIALANSVQPMQSQEVINQVLAQFKIKGDTSLLDSSGQMEDLNNLEIPALNTSLELEESRRINDLWYQRPSRGHYIGLNKDDFGNTGDYLIYTNKSWRTLASPDQIEVGMDVKVSYGGGKFAATFSVADKAYLPTDRSFLFSKVEGRQIILIVDDAANHKYYGYSLVPK